MEWRKIIAVLIWAGTTIGLIAYGLLETPTEACLCLIMMAIMGIYLNT